MDEKNSIGRDCSIRCVRKIGRIALLVMLPWNVYAAADRFPGAQVQLDGLVNAAALVDSPSAAVSFETPAQESNPEGASLDVNAGGEIPQSEVANQELAYLDVVDTGLLKQELNLRPAPAVPLGTASLKSEGASGSADSEEIIQLPYAVLLAILALISMVPVSRRNG